MSRLKPDPLTPQRLAELCLSHLAEDPEVLGEFLVQSGYSPDRLRKALGTETLDRGLIDYFAQDQYKELDPEARMLDDLTSLAGLKPKPNSAASSAASSSLFFSPSVSDASAAQQTVCYWPSNW